MDLRNIPVRARMKFLRFVLSNLKDPSFYEIGSVRWLQSTERNFGGLALNINRNKISQQDTHSAEYLDKAGMTGGDRMYFHGYARHYSKYLKQYLNNSAENVVLIEIGILKGSGLALWSNLFPKAKIIGLDIDLKHTQDNLKNLEELGGFEHGLPELFEFDQFVNNEPLLGDIVKGAKIDVIIDDGEHSSEAILKTISSVAPFLSENFTYFIEDNRKVYKLIRRLYPEWKILHKDQFTVIRPR